MYDRKTADECIEGITPQSLIAMATGDKSVDSPERLKILAITSQSDVPGTETASENMPSCIPSDGVSAVAMSLFRFFHQIHGFAVSLIVCSASSVLNVVLCTSSR
jgi:hypothetical protein